MPLYEFVCLKHGTFEKMMPMDAQIALCETVLDVPNTESKPNSVFPTVKCGATCERIEFSVPAKRNPRYGEG